MNPLLELAGRVEAATGSDRELDGAVLMALSLDQPYSGSFHAQGTANDYSVLHGMTMIEAIAQGCPARMASIHFKAPAYTASLDAAMTLVPEGSLWGTGSDVEGPFARLCIVTGIGYIGGEQEAVFAATPALALTAASLRAIASMGSSG